MFHHFFFCPPVPALKKCPVGEIGPSKYEEEKLRDKEVTKKRLRGILSLRALKRAPGKESAELQYTNAPPHGLNRPPVPAIPDVGSKLLINS
jgi:hypothetical protein